MSIDNEPIGTTLIFENDVCRVWHLELAPGAASSWHTHGCPYSYVVTRPGPVHTEYQNGEVEHQNDPRGTTVHRSGGDLHRLVSNSPELYENIIVELKERP